MSISRTTTEKVKERVDIEDVVNDYVPLKKRGQNLWACCPFHNEKSPSFSVSPAKQIYKCFGCGKAGDPIQFVMDVEGIGFNEAIRHLAKKYGIEVEEERSQRPEDVQAYNEKESLYIVLNFAKDFFVKSLATDEGKAIGESYFRERGLTQAIIQKFELGYALDGWDHLLNAAKANGHSLDLLIKAGLVLQKEGDDEKFYDRFRNRVTFTIHNLGGKTVGFGARILTQDKKQPKYINSPESPVYHKSDVLYGLFQAKKSIREKDNCYLVEGYTDVLSMHLAGIENVVSSSGTSLTEGQIKLIKRFTDNVTILYDGDQAGIKASLRGIDMLLEGGLNVKAVTFPIGEDPDSYSRKVGAAQFTEYLQSKKEDFIAFKISIYADEVAKDPIKKAELIRDVIQSLSKIPDPIIRSVYTKQSSLLLEVEEDIIISELNKIFLKEQKNKNQKEKQEAEKEQEDSPIENFLPGATAPNYSSQLEVQEREMIRMLINYGHEMVSDDMRVCDYLFQEISDLTITTPICLKILKLYQEALSNGLNPKSDYFLSVQDQEIKQEVIHLITEKHDISSLWEEKHQIFTFHESDDLAKSIHDNILRLKQKIVRKMLDEAKHKVKEAEANGIDNEGLNELLLVFMELKKIQMEIDKQLGIVIS
jgi:DNA primase